MSDNLSDQTRNYIKKRIAVGVTAGQIQTELLTREVFVPFAVLLSFDPERKGAIELPSRQRQEMKRMLQNASSRPLADNARAPSDRGIGPGGRR